MRPRKPLDEAVKWYSQSKLVKTSRLGQVGYGKSAPSAAHEAQYLLQIVEIEVGSTRSLRISGQNNSFAQRRMTPFFTYDFYTFNHTSAVVVGNEPNFSDTKRFEVSNSADFVDYLNAGVLKIDFIDDSVEMT